MSDEVFILDLRRADGSRFITSVGSAGGISTARMRHKGVAGQVSHWRRDEVTRIPGLRGPTILNDWRLSERFAL